jgi:hypothetical protein
MPISKQGRSDPAVVRDVIDLIFEQSPSESKQTGIEFLAEEIEYLSLRHPDRWGVTLFEWGMRLNIGWVECLVLHSSGLRVLAEKESAPTGTTFDGVAYDSAPGCEFTTVPLPELPQTLASFAESHHATLSIAARRRPGGNIRNAHSPGVTALLSQALRRPIQILHMRLQGNLS